MQENYPVQRIEMSKKDAIELFREKGEAFKVEILQQIEDETVSLYQQGTFIDLCRGPHVGATGHVKAFKVLHAAGAYWRGDERNPMLQRIYGTSFPTREELDAHLQKLEEIKRRDHRKLGKELDLFSSPDDTGPGLILWHPKGALVRLLIENFWRDSHVKHGYELIYSPHVARLELWETSGHLDYYKENMFAPMTVETGEYQLKPMNCPFHIMVYKSHLRSYRELPIRYGELGTVYRYERSGVLHGLMRVRGFTQDDAHIFCRPDQVASEVRQVLDFTMFVLRRFGFTEFALYLSTRPEKAVGSVEKWDQATEALEAALKASGFPYEVDPGEGVFYGPKIDLKIHDALGRAWQCSTVQIDFNNPERFGLSYIGEDGAAHQPIMIYRALLGSIERFFGILVEHYAGAFPTWLAPVQAIVLPITDKQADYASHVRDRLADAGLRVSLDLRKEKVGLKIREAEKAKNSLHARRGRAGTGSSGGLGPETQRDERRDTAHYRGARSDTTRYASRIIDPFLSSLMGRTVTPKHRVNHLIRVPEVRVIGPESEQLGILKTSEALKLAHEGGYDLVEVAPTSTPPVCRIMDYGKFKYEQSKKDHKTRQHQKSTQVKEIKFRPRTDKHDLETKIRQILDFLADGTKTKVTVMFRGREMANQELGRAAMGKVREEIKEAGTIEMEPRMEGRNLYMIVAPKN